MQAKHQATKADFLAVTIWAFVGMCLSVALVPDWMTTGIMISG